MKKITWKIFFLISIAVLLLGYTVYDYQNIPTTQNIEISSIQLFTFQHSYNFSEQILCVFNLLSVIIIILYLKYILLDEYIKEEWTTVFLGALVGISAALPGAGLMLFGALLIYMIIFLTFVLGLAETLETITYACAFYMMTLTVIVSWQFGLALALGTGIILFIFSYLLVKIISFLIVFLFYFIPWLFEFIIYRLTGKELNKFFASN